MYEILLERTAEKDLNRLPAEIFHRIISPVKKLADNPWPSGSRKIAGVQNSWRIRIGDYRVIYYDIDDKQKTAGLMAAQQMNPDCCHAGRRSGTQS